jgi:hypothetical protein
MERCSIALTKPTRKLIPSLRYFVIKHHGSTLSKGYCSYPKLLNTHAIPFIGYTKNTLDSITYFWKHGKVLCNLTKTYKETNTLIKYYVIKHHGFTLLEGYCSCQKLFNTLALTLTRYPKNTLIGLYIISFETWRGNA